MKIMVINGPNLNLLGIREKEIYGAKDFNQVIDYIKEEGKELGLEVNCLQSNIAVSYTHLDVYKRQLNNLAS